MGALVRPMGEQFKIILQGPSIMGENIPGVPELKDFVLKGHSLVLFGIDPGWHRAGNQGKDFVSMQQGFPGIQVADTGNQAGCRQDRTVYQCVGSAWL